MHRTVASAVLLVAALATGGCAAQRTIVEARPSAARSLTTDRAFVTLGQGAPTALSVIESDYSNATRQTIALTTRGRTPGENQLQVDVFGLKNDNVAHDSSLPDSPLKASELAAEAQEALPEVPLRLSTSYLQNQYGPFGYLVGKTAQGDTCMYAWQRLATPDSKLSLINSRNAIAIRARLCDPVANEAALAATMMNLSINVALSSGSWMPDANQLSADIGASNAPIAPPQIVAAAANRFPQSPAAPPRGAKRVKRAPAPVRAPSAAPASLESANSGVVVPPPPLDSPNAPPIPSPPGTKAPQPQGSPQ